MNPLPSMRDWAAANLPAPTPKARKPKAPLVRTPATPDDLRAIAAIAFGKVNYCPGTGVKRFARDIQGATELTDRQRHFVWSTVWTFRHQIADKSLVETAKGMMDADAKGVSDV